MQENQPKVEMLSIKVKAKINLTADDWELYSIPGRDQAARRMNRAVEKLLAKGELNGLGSALVPFAKWGACDTEGYYALQEIMHRLGLDKDRLF